MFGGGKRNLKEIVEQIIFQRGFGNHPNLLIRQLIPGDYVTTEDGTGIVHIAPNFGADDALVARKAGVPPIVMIDKTGEERPVVDLQGKYYVVEDLDADFVKNHVNLELWNRYAGRYVKNAYDDTLTDKDETLDISICMDLKSENKAFKIEKHVHNYPHCWRTDKPVLYYPLDSWFIRSTAGKERMVELNKTINFLLPSKLCQDFT